MAIEKSEVRKVRREDVESFAEKLDAFAASLNEAERLLLARVLATATVIGDTEETGFSTPLANNIARAANFVKGQLATPKSPLVNPGILRAKDVNYFQGFPRK